jgi:hypothetical protein
MNEQRINELKRSLAEFFNLLRDEEITDELEARVIQVLEHVANRIQELRQEDQMEAQADQGIQEAENVIQNPEGQQGSGGGGGGVPITPEPIPEIEPAPHESSNIEGFKYDPKSGKLYVRFLGKYPNRNGSVYSYEGIPKNIFELIYRGAVGPKTSGKNRWHKWTRNVLPSHGAAIAHLIKAGGYPYKRLS